MTSAPADCTSAPRTKAHGAPAWEGSAVRLDGKWLSSQFQSETRSIVERESKRVGRPPGLGVILVGDNPASHAYVANKEKFARGCGFVTRDHRLSADATLQQVQSAIEDFNSDTNVDGILLQLPLPKGLPQNELLDRIDPTKDADGLHPLNQGLLMRGEDGLRPCTPRGVMALLDLALGDTAPNDKAPSDRTRSDVASPAREVSLEPSKLLPADLKGRHAVVLGRSILVGKPVGLMLLERNATVTYAHSKTDQLEKVVRSADIVVAAVGVPRLVKAEWVKPGAIVIDVGINRVASGALEGDVDTEEVSKVAAALTPVPGGVGPMTVAMLMDNTLKSYLKRISGCSK